MSHFAQKMAFYSAYHQEPTNIWIHVAGVPTITFSAFVALSTLPLGSVNGVMITAASVMYLLSTLYYLWLDRAIGAVAAVLYGVLLLAANEVAGMGAAWTWGVFAAGQIVGWGTQIYGHLHFEKNRPAFYENISQSLISAPIFVVADVFFHLGLKRELQREVTQILADTGRLREFSAAHAHSA